MEFWGIILMVGGLFLVAHALSRIDEINTDKTNKAISNGTYLNSNNNENKKELLIRAAASDVEELKKLISKYGINNISLETMKLCLLASMKYHSLDTFRYILSIKPTLVNCEIDLDKEDKISVLGLLACHFTTEEVREYFLIRATMIEWILDLDIDNINNIYAQHTIFDMLLFSEDNVTGMATTLSDSFLGYESFNKTKFELLNKLIKHKNFNPNTLGYTNRTPLVQVLGRMYKEECKNEKEFLESLAINIINLEKTDVNIDCLGELAIFSAMGLSNYKIFEGIIKKGADIELKNLWGLNPFSLAVSLGDEKFKKIILDNIDFSEMFRKKVNNSDGIKLLDENNDNFQEIEEDEDLDDIEEDLLDEDLYDEDL